MNYEEVEARPRSEVVALLESKNASMIATGLYSASYHDRDWRWVQQQCLRFLTYEDVKVRWAAATCLGDLAVFHKNLELPVVLPALQEALNDTQIRSAVQDSLDLIHANVPNKNPRNQKPKTGKTEKPGDRRKTGDRKL